MTEPGVCNGASVTGVLQTDESIHITYIFKDENGITGIQCEDYATVTNTATTPKDVILEESNKK